MYSLPTTLSKDNSKNFSKLPKADDFCHRRQVSVGQRVRQAREVRRLSGNELDRRMGTSQGYTSRLESSERQPRADTITKLAEVLEVRPQWLLTGEGPMVDQPEPTTDTYPNREVAIAAAGASWLPETVETLRTVCWNSDVDPAPRWWRQMGEQIDVTYRLGLREAAPEDDEPVDDLKVRR